MVRDTRDTALRTARIAQIKLIRELQAMGVDVPATADATLVCNLASRALDEIELGTTNGPRMGICTRNGVAA